MTEIKWGQPISGPTLEQAFARIREEARTSYGYEASPTGPNAGHPEITLISSSPVTEAHAWELVETVHGYWPNARAIRLLTLPGQTPQWLVFAQSYK